MTLQDSFPVLTFCFFRREPWFIIEVIAWFWLIWCFFTGLICIFSFSVQFFSFFRVLFLRLRLIFQYSNVLTFRCVIVSSYRLRTFASFGAFSFFDRLLYAFFLKGNSFSFRFSVIGTWQCLGTNFWTGFFFYEGKILSHMVLAICLNCLWFSFWLKNSLLFGWLGRCYRWPCLFIFFCLKSKKIRPIFCIEQPFRVIFDTITFSFDGFLQVWVSNLNQGA